MTEDEVRAHAFDPVKAKAAVETPGFLLKIIADGDCRSRICEPVRYAREDVTNKSAWEGPVWLELFHHALAPMAASGTAWWFTEPFAATGVFENIHAVSPTSPGSICSPM
ncbi:acetoacetate decarboxylase family protein [Thermomonas hydrothermalis]|uniref:Acetoacetate decarboxylase (ADC) n=1 Tax=Thermomonas hydrothermalis TaxID=213588 RepID=A0A1M4ZTS4_9GAMM|nr:acetoacetate decarboxylase family protein [Thermomonas hydrothermalis]MCL6618897.1 acetoacetate decarboxylase family protein [Thermomonas hydrothermalis]SHF21408.1 Acetoacetate decarboxylase (ADC) [Thermomonas hydrothermalis]